MLTTLMIIAIVLLSAALIVLIAVSVVCLRRLDEMARELGETLKSVRESVIPLADESRQTLAEVESYARSARAAAERVQQVGESLERLLEGKTVADAAGKAVTASRVTLVSIVEGVKQALKTFKTAKKEPEEESEDDQS